MPPGGHGKARPPIADSPFFLDASRGRPKTEILEPKYPSRLCYCNYDYCQNSTCVAEPDAACFHAITYQRNSWGEWDRNSGYHDFGCFPPEAGGSALQCHGHLIHHRTPKTVACCFEGDYCNEYLDPPKANYDPDDVVRPPWSATQYLLLVGVPLLVSVLLFIIGFLWLRFYCARRKQRKCSSDSDSTFDLDLSDGQHPSKLNSLIKIRYFEDWKKRWALPKVLQPLLGSSEKLSYPNPASWAQVKEMFADESSGSGSGLPRLTHRTVAKQLVYKEPIGQGRYGAVCLASFRNELVAVKTFLTTEEASWKNEAEIYNTPLLRHENILGFIAADITSTRDAQTEKVLIMDYCKHGSLYDYLTRNVVSPTEALSLALTAVRGLEHLHNETMGTQVAGGNQCKPAIAHRDIKSKNILVKAPGVCVIADFGLAIKCSSSTRQPEMTNKKNSRIGTIRYMAPEILNNTIKSNTFNAYKQADMYAFGLVLWEITRRIEEDAVPYREDASVSSGASGSSLSVHAPVSRRLSPNRPPFHPGKPNEVWEDSGVSSTGTDGSGSGLQLPLVHRRHRPKEYLSPYEDLAPFSADRELNEWEMRKIVVEQKKRPPIEEHWLEDGTITYELARVMQECWRENPDARLTASNVKKRLAHCSTGTL